MAGRHSTSDPGAALFLEGTRWLHRQPAHLKIAATFLAVVAFVATPREAFVVLAADFALLGAVATSARLPLRRLVRRLAIEVPFLLFALFLPLVGGGRRIPVLGLSLSVAGLWALWNIFAKATLGLGATLLLTASTPVPDLIDGLRRLRMPKVIVAIMSFMVRYLGVIAGEMERMRIARISRGHNPRWLWQARALASSAGALFIRSYERGERVYLAMLARGYAGEMPEVGPGGGAAGGARAGLVLVLPALAAAGAAIGWTLLR